MKFRLRIKEIREAHGMTLDELARKVYYNFRTVRDWERGRYVPPVSTLLVLAEIFSCTLDDLIEKKEE